MIEPDHPLLSIEHQCGLVSIELLPEPGPVLLAVVCNLIET